MINGHVAYLGSTEKLSSINSTFLLQPGVQKSASCSRPSLAVFKSECKKTSKEAFCIGSSISKPSLTLLRYRLTP